MIRQEQPKDILTADSSEAEGQRAEILRAALFQLLAETEKQMMHIEEVFKTLDETHPPKAGNEGWPEATMT